MLFSEPKIPQCNELQSISFFNILFQCSSASRKFLNWKTSANAIRRARFQCSSASRKFLNLVSARHLVLGATVSVLFSEPKIPQLLRGMMMARNRVAFQCSSASRKFLNNWSRAGNETTSPRFSALQRAENSSISRNGKHRRFFYRSFSALQRAENSSITARGKTRRLLPEFQCSSASRKFLNGTYWLDVQSGWLWVSVLFSEPKIPQSRPSHLRPSIFPTAMITLRHS